MNDQNPPEDPQEPGSETPEASHDPAPEAPPPPAAGGSEVESSSTGIDPKLAGLLCYILGIVTGLVFFLIEKTHSTVRFHAAQSILYSLATIAVWIVLGIFDLVLAQISWTMASLFAMVQLLVYLGLFVLWVILLIKGYSGEKWKLPVLGDMAERMAGGGAA